MDRIFLAVLNMSLTSSFVIAAVMLARLILRRAPKTISYAMWAVVLFNLLCPFKPESMFSLNPIRANLLTEQAMVPGRDFGFAGAGYYLLEMGLNPLEDRPIYVNPDPAVVESNPYKYNEPADDGSYYRYLFGTEAWMIFFSYLWPVGMAVLLLYAIIGYIRLKRRVSLAVRVDGNIYETGRIDSPFVLGLIRPRIYIPEGLEPKLNAHIIEHERTHIRRRDYIVSVVAFAALTLHWFNPLAWIAYVLMLRDMESSCDESVLRKSGGDIRFEYSSALLNFSHNKRRLSFPLAFGEQGVKGRIKNVLNFKKPSRIIVASGLAVVIVLSVGFALNRAQGANENAWELFTFPYSNYNDPDNASSPDVKLTFQTDSGTYPPSVQAISARLTNATIPGGLTCGESFKLVKRVGNDWRVVPFGDGKWTRIAWHLDIGHIKVYTIKTSMFAAELTPGSYRIVTDVWYDDDTREIIDDTRVRESLTVWAGFLISENEAGEPERTAPERMQPDRNVPISLGVYATDDGLTQVVFHGNFEFFISRYAASYMFAHSYVHTGTWVYDVPPNDGKVILRSADEAQRHVFSYTDDTLVFESGEWLENWNEPGTVFTLTGLWEPEAQEATPAADADGGFDPRILNQVYLGMTSEEVYALFGEPDYRASGLMMRFIYNDIGTFDFGSSFSSSGLIERISLNDSKSWSVYDLINGAVILHYGHGPTGAYSAAWHQIESFDINEKGFSVTGIAQYELYVPDGENDVRLVGWEYANIEMTFAKNANYNYVLTSSIIDDGALPSDMPLVRGRYNYIPLSSFMDEGILPSGMPLVLRCYDQAKYHFLGAVPSNSTRFDVNGFGNAIVLTDILGGIPTTFGYAIIIYYPGATLAIEDSNTRQHAGSTEQTLIIEFTDPTKNITFGKGGVSELSAIPITEDLIGIYSVDESQYAMKFERYREG